MSDYIFNNFPNDDNNDNNDEEKITLDFDKIDSQNNHGPTRYKRKKSSVAYFIVFMFILLIFFSISAIFFINYYNHSNNKYTYSDNKVYTVASNVSASSTDVVTPTSGEYMTIAQAAALVKDTVVEVRTQYVVQSRYYQYVQSGAGSGVIIGTFDGGYYIVTNAHVIETSSNGIASDISIRTTDGKEYVVEDVIGSNSYKDIAVLSIVTNDTLKVAPIVGASEPILGEEVIVIGNPLGQLGGTLTNGIISALDREITIDGSTLNLLQTNAEISPGNSGGGMFNLKGELIGIVNAKSTGSDVEGLGFAIPIDDASDTIVRLISKGSGSLGIQAVEVTSRTGTNVYVHSLLTDQDNPFEVYDIILSMDDQPIESITDYNKFMSEKDPGDVINVKVNRNNKVIELQVTVYKVIN